MVVNDHKCTLVLQEGKLGWCSHCTLRAKEYSFVQMCSFHTSKRILINYSLLWQLQPNVIKASSTLLPGPMTVRTETEMYQNDALRSYDGTFIKWTSQQLHLLTFHSAWESPYPPGKNQPNIPIISSFICSEILSFSYTIWKYKNSNNIWQEWLFPT